MFNCSFGEGEGARGSFGGRRQGGVRRVEPLANLLLQIVPYSDTVLMCPSDDNFKW